MDQFFDILASYCRRLVVLHLVLLGDLQSIFLFYTIGTNFEEVALIATKGFYERIIFSCMLVDWNQPLLCVQKTFVVCDVECNYDCICLLVVLVGKVSEFLLSCRVPQLNLNFSTVFLGCVVNVDLVQTAGSYMRVDKLSAIKRLKNGGFPDRSIPDHHYVDLWFHLVY